jgi:hypothetical protein
LIIKDHNTHVYQEAKTNYSNIPATQLHLLIIANISIMIYDKNSDIDSLEPFTKSNQTIPDEHGNFSYPLDEHEISGGFQNIKR